MARIRSIHPSLFTDEAFVSCSPLARVLYIGLMTEADDQGLFEWKPVQIKLRLLGVDNCDVPDLLAELLDVNLIAQLESGGKRLGAIRKFRKFQRPKKPSAQFALPYEWRTYVSLDEDGSEPDGVDDAPSIPPPKADGSPVGNQFRTGGELGSQMEDGGWRKKDGGDSSGSDEPLSALAEEIWLATPIVGRRRSSRADLQRAVKAAVQRRRKPPERLKAGVDAYYASPDATKDDGQFAMGVHRLIENDRWAEFAPESPPDRRNGNGFYYPPTVIRDPSEKRQRAWATEYLEHPNWWKEHERGPPPGQPGCQIAPAILDELGISEPVH